MTVQPIATLKVGQKCIDYASWRDYDAMSALGVRCVGRYISTSSNFLGAPVYTWKSLTPAEVAELHRRGIGVVAFWEASAGDPLQGELKGVAHGVQAAKSLTVLGYPHGLPCIAAVDIDATPANINQCAAYMKGFKAGLGGRWATGVYGDVDIIKRCAADGTASFFHYAGASSWSHGEFSSLIHWRQRIVGSTPQYDDNVVLRDCDMWLPHEVATIPPDVVQPPAPLLEDFDTMIASPAAAYDSRNPGAGGPLYVRAPGKPGSRTINVAPKVILNGTVVPAAKRAQVVITPIGFAGRGHLRWSGNGVEPDFSEAQFWTGYPPMPLAMTVDLNGDGALDVWIEGEDGAACDVIISRTHVNS